MAMSVEPMIRSVFGPFQNLNLLVLLEDLRRGRTAQGDWAYRDQLCPVAHGLASGRQVCDLETVDQTVSLGRACDLAARHLGANPASVYRFVRYWDNQAFSPTWLLRQLEELWNERRADAEAVQEMLTRTHTRQSTKLDSGIPRQEAPTDGRSIRPARPADAAGAGRRGDRHPLAHGT
jgi:hypothetical protein